MVAPFLLHFRTLFFRSVRAPHLASLKLIDFLSPNFSLLVNKFLKILLLIIRRSPVATQHIYDVCQHEMDDPSQLHVGISKFDVKTSKSNIITK